MRSMQYWKEEFQHYYKQHLKKMCIRDRNIRTRLADAELQHPQKQKKDEQILLDVLGL